MNAPNVVLKLDPPEGAWMPGQPLRGQFHGETAAVPAMRAVELSVLWYTAGQGDEDFAVHHFQRWVDEPAHRIDLRRPQPFSVVLPASPLSYDGRIVKVCWCVRLRLFPQQGPEAIVELPFQLGEVSPAADASEVPS